MHMLRKIIKSYPGLSGIELRSAENAAFEKDPIISAPDSCSRTLP